MTGPVAPTERPWVQGAFPYNGTSGYAAGSPTSEDRTRALDATGTTTRWQALALGEIGARGRYGATWPELARLLAEHEGRPIHHGQASGVLSNLHKVGRLARLDWRRDRCAVYVLPEHVADRPTQPHGSNRHAPARYVLTYASLTQALKAEGLEGRDAARARRALRRLGIDITT